MGPINSKAEASLVPYKVSKIPMRRISRRERGAGLGTALGLAHFQLQVACDVFFFLVGRKQQQRKKTTKIDQKLGAILDLKISLESLSSSQVFCLGWVFFVILWVSLVSVCLIASTVIAGTGVEELRAAEDSQQTNHATLLQQLSAEQVRVVGCGRCFGVCCVYTPVN